MRSLIAEDDFVSRNILARILAHFGASDVATDGVEAVRAFESALQAQEPYSLVCLDIEMPNLDGQKALRQIRQLEETAGTPLGQRCVVLMTTAHEDPSAVLSAFRGDCDGYLVKPISLPKVREALSRSNHPEVREVARRSQRA